jgi:MtN3 and saliva related transmembrane protein
MDSTTIEILGLIAGAITSIGYLPQIYKGYKTKELDDVSYYMPGILALGMTLWFIYGIILNAIAVIVANIFGVSCSLLLIIMKKRYSHF